LKRIVFACVALFAGACGVLNPHDIPATLQAQNAAYVAEATSIADSLAAREVELAITAQAVATTVANVTNINRQLVATAQAVIPPTSARQVGVAPGAEGAGTPGSTGNAQFVDTVVTVNKRDSDGCADGFQTEFTSDTARIYAITRALTVSAGTVVSVEWLNNNQSAGQGSYTVTENQTDFCIWFPFDGPLAPGNWTAQVFVNDQPIQPSITFTVTASNSDS
jgi:hypothetical protein